jgi:hypothetical protein
MVALLPALSVVVLSALLPQGPHDVHASARDDGANEGLLIAQSAREHSAPIANDGAPVPLREEDLPWCVSADDPRCAPLHNDAGRFGSDSSVGFTAAQPHADALPPKPPACETWTPSSGLAPRLGVSHRVERPPRGAGGRVA